MIAIDPAKIMNGPEPKAYPPEQKREFMLATIRVARARLGLLTVELDEIAVALEHNMIGPEDAVTWLDFIGAVDFINAEPWPTRIEVVP